MKSILAKFTLTLLSLLLAAMALEGILIVGGWPTGSLVHIVPGKGMVHLPGARYVHSKEGFSEGRFNSHGFRDRERSWEKPPGTFRVLVLGDSYVEAMQVDLEKSFPARLESMMNESMDVPVEVLALGQSGFGTTESLVRYRHFGRLYDPDLVILTVTTGNDFRNNHKQLNGAAIGHYYVYDAEGQLELDDSLMRNYEASLGVPKRAYTWFRQHSRLVGLVSRRLQLLRRQSLHEGTGESHAGSLLEQGSDLNIYVQDAGGLWDEAVNLTRDVLLLAAAEVRQDGSRFAVVSLTNAEQVHRDIGEALQERVGRPLEWMRPENLLAEWCAREGISYLPLLPPFQRAWDADRVDLHGFDDRRTGHWNAQGHQLAAEVIWDFLNDSGLLVPQGDGESPMHADDVQ